MFSFSKRKKKVDMAPFIRRIIDLTTPNKPTIDDQRFELRYNRTMPALLHPWVNNSPDLKRTTIGITKDFCDHGVGMIAISELDEPQYVISIWPQGEDVNEPYHFIANLRDFRKLSLGMWTAGFEFEDLVNSAAAKWLDELNDVAERALLPGQEDLAGV